MPSSRFGVVWVYLGVAVAWCMLSPAASAVEVWSDFTFEFTKSDGTDGSFLENQDYITPNAVLARGDSKGLYNAAYEVNYLDEVSPEYTAWATYINNPEVEVAATNYEALTFEPFAEAYGFQVGAYILEESAVLHLTLEDIYLDVQFTSWTNGQNFPSGGFSYLRAEPPTSGDYNGNLIVDAADFTVWRDTLGQFVDEPGDGADGSRNRVIDLPDYDHWKARFGNGAPTGAGGGQLSAVPEPTAGALLLGELLLLATFRHNKLPLEARRRFS